MLFDVGLYVSYVYFVYDIIIIIIIRDTPLKKKTENRVCPQRPASSRAKRTGVGSIRPYSI